MQHNIAYVFRVLLVLAHIKLKCAFFCIVFYIYIVNLIYIGKTYIKNLQYFFLAISHQPKPKLMSKILKPHYLFRRAPYHNSNTLPTLKRFKCNNEKRQRRLFFFLFNRRGFPRPSLWNQEIRREIIKIYYDSNFQETKCRQVSELKQCFIM